LYYPSNDWGLLKKHLVEKGKVKRYGREGGKEGGREGGREEGGKGGREGGIA
jgi:hypothetical protein